MFREDPHDIRLYTEDGKLNAPLLAQSIIYDDFEINNGFLVTKDNMEIWRYNGGYYEPDGEEVIRSIVQEKLGEECTTHIKNEVISWVKDQSDLWVERDLFDENIHLINLQNGIYNIENDEFIEHNPSYFLSTQIPVNYDPDAKINQIEQFLQDILYIEDIPIIQELTGYFLYRDYPIQKAFMLEGDGSNGKSTLINLFTAFLGKKNISTISLQDLIYQRFARASLYRKLANLYSDLPDKAVKDTGVFKMLTGGDMIYADRKFKEPFYFRNYAKLVFSTNKIPEAEDNTDAYFRRWIIISFPNKFEGNNCDKNILKKLTTEEELNGFFNWAIEGLKRLLKNKEFSYSKSTELIRDEYERKSSPIAAFVKDCIEEDPEGVETKEDVYNAYKEYCKEEHMPIKTNNVFSRDLKMYVKNISEGQRRIDGKKTWRGIKLKI